MKAILGYFRGLGQGVVGIVRDNPYLCLAALALTLAARFGGRIGHIVAFLAFFGCFFVYLPIHCFEQVQGRKMLFVVTVRRQPGQWLPRVSFGTEFV